MIHLSFVINVKNFFAVPLGTLREITTKAFFCQQLFYFFSFFHENFIWQFLIIYNVMNYKLIEEFGQFFCITKYRGLSGKLTKQ